MSRKIAVAVVGLGIGTDHIAEAYARHRDKFELVRICDTNAEILHKVQEQFGVKKSCSDFAEVLADPDVEVVDICTPPFTHYAMIMQSLAAGKSVICEKPLVGSLKEVDEIIREEQRSPGRVMPIFQMRYGTGIAQTRALIASGIIGRPQIATIETMWNRPPEYYQVPWRAKWKTELGGVLTSQAIHAHDLLTHLLGPVRSVFARTDNRQYDMEIEDTLSATVLLTSGVPASLTATVAAADEITRLRLVFEHVTMESDHSPYNPGGAPWTILVRKESIVDEVNRIVASVGEKEHCFSGQMLAYYDTVIEDTEPPVTLQDARASIELATAMHFSSRTASEVVFPIGKQHPYYTGWAL
jgi:predicted dehydrogenase